MFVGSPEAMWHQGGAGTCHGEGSPWYSLSLKGGKEVYSELPLSCCLTLNKFPFSHWSSIAPSVTGLPASILAASNSHPVVIFYIVSRSGLLKM